MTKAERRAELLAILARHGLTEEAATAHAKQADELVRRIIRDRRQGSVGYARG